MVAKNRSLPVLVGSFQVLGLIGGKEILEGFFPNPLDLVLGILERRNVVRAVAGVNAFGAALFLRALVRINEHSPLLRLPPGGTAPGFLRTIENGERFPARKRHQASAGKFQEFLPRDLQPLFWDAVSSAGG